MDDSIGIFRVEAIENVTDDLDGWMADGWVGYVLTLRPMDRRGHVNGRTRNLTTLKVGGPPGTVDLGGLTVGAKAEFTYWAGPAPTEFATLRPA